VVTAGSTIESILAEHLEDAGFLWSQRNRYLEAPQVTLRTLRRLDDRLEAHLDGLRIAQSSDPSCMSFEPDASAEQMFVATALALDSGGLESVLAEARTAEHIRAATAAFGWVSGKSLRGIVRRLLESGSVIERRLAIAACAVHRVGAEALWIDALQAEDTSLRARALRAAGELGLCNLLPHCQQHLDEDHTDCLAWAAWSCVLLGDRARALDVLERCCLPQNPWSRRGLRLYLQAAPLQRSRRWLAQFARSSADRRFAVQSVGITGDPGYVPWLISQMRVAQLARVASDAFTLITGADLVDQELEGECPEGFSAGPNEDPEDENVETDPDQDLRWPDMARVELWWDKNQQRFQEGTPYLLGQPPTREHCIQVLKGGGQQQRKGAALHLPLLAPGTALFEWRAPAWRQQRVLSQMGSS
jgi:uncharacterized protein (TIGR02270 family)